ncbi:MAG: PP2C family serine/threonine-protein phosphatase, partial [Ilumatobacter sp.]
MAELAWGAGTHPGQIRPENEDTLHASNGIYVVADGMGGHEAGEIASALAVERIRDVLIAEDLAPTAERVVEAISDANGDIFRAAIANPGQAGMGTTVTAIAVIEDPMAGRGAPNIDDNDGLDLDKVTPIVPRDQPEALVLANVGDSRTYLYRHGRLRRVTIDHSYVQELVSTGHITDDEARTHPRRNIITRALGIEPDVKVDWWTLPLVRGDRFVLCSDGLVDEVPDNEISEVLRSNPDPQTAVDLLIAMANAAGGRDNVTVIIVDVLEGDDPPDPTQEIDLTPVWADDPAMSPDDLARIEAGDLELTGARTPSEEVAVAKLSRRARRRARRSGARDADESTGADTVAPSGSGTDTTTDDNDAVAVGALGATTGVTDSETTTDTLTTTDDDRRDVDTDGEADADADAGAPNGDDAPPGAERARRPRLGRMVGGFVALALLISGFVVFAAWARSGYFIDFDDDDRVTVYKGQPGGVL